MGARRVPITVNWETVKAAIRIHATETEVAMIAGLTDEKSLARLIKRDQNMTMAQFFKKERAYGNVSLRRAQWKKGVEEGDGMMLRWLGKNLLGQEEKVSISSAAGQIHNMGQVLVQIVVKAPDNTILSPAEIARNWYDYEPRPSSQAIEPQAITVSSVQVENPTEPTPNSD